MASDANNITETRLEMARREVERAWKRFTPLTAGEATTVVTPDGEEHRLKEGWRNPAVDEARRIHRFLIATLVVPDAYRVETLKKIARLLPAERRFIVDAEGAVDWVETKPTKQSRAERMREVLRVCTTALKNREDHGYLAGALRRIEPKEFAKFTADRAKEKLSKFARPERLATGRPKGGASKLSSPRRLAAELCVEHHALGFLQLKTAIDAFNKLRA